MQGTVAVFFWKAFIVPHLFVDVKSDDNSCVNNQKREHLDTAKQSWRAASVSVDSRFWGVA